MFLYMSHLYSILHKTLSNSLIDNLIWMICEYAHLWAFDTVTKYTNRQHLSFCVRDSTLYYIISGNVGNGTLVIESISNCCLFRIHSFNISPHSYDVSVSDLYIYVFTHNFQESVIIDIYDKKTYIHRGEHRLMGYISSFLFPRSKSSYEDGYIYIFSRKWLFSYTFVHKISEKDLTDSVKYTNITVQIERYADCIQGARKYNYYGINTFGEKEYITSDYFYVFPNSSLLYRYIKLDDNILLVRKENEFIFMKKIIPKKQLVPERQTTIMKIYSDIKKLIFD